VGRTSSAGSPWSYVKFRARPCAREPNKRILAAESCIAAASDTSSSAECSRDATSERNHCWSTLASEVALSREKGETMPRSCPLTCASYPSSTCMTRAFQCRLNNLLVCEAARNCASSTTAQWILHPQEGQTASACHHIFMSSRGMSKVWSPLPGAAHAALAFKPM
jgi:hypothetical protein